MTKEMLNQKLTEFKNAQHEARRQFKIALDQMYVDQRAKMATIRRERAMAIAEYKKTKLETKANKNITAVSENTANVIANSEAMLKNIAIQM